MSGRGAALALAALAWTAAQNLPAEEAELPVVSAVDLGRFMGRWYEIAAFPSLPQRGCSDTVVYYKLAEGGGFELLNTCWKSGKFKPYRGKAKPLDPKSSAKFYARFVLFLGSPYWIIDLDPEYKYAAVSGPKRDRLWIISREPGLDAKTYAAMLERLKALGLDTSRLVQTVQSGKTPPGDPFALF